MPLRILLSLATLFLVSGPVAAKAPPRIVASIPPVHALVAQVLAGVGEPYLMVKGTASPHSSVLKASDAAALERADLVFWMGPALEPFLGRALRPAARSVDAIDLSKIDGLIRHPIRAGAIWPPDDHPAAKSRPRGSDAGYTRDARGGFDPHLWLSPVNAAMMIDHIAVAVAKRDPARAALYRRNASRARASLAALDAALARMLEPVRGRPFIVFHDAYQYFDRHYRLAAAGAILLHDGDRPGVKRLRDIRAAIAGRGIVCVFSERQTNSRLVSTVIEGTGARTGALDPLGVGQAPGPRAYEEVLRDLAKRLVDCLAE